MNRNPFARASAIAAALIAASMLSDPMARQAAMGKVPEYRSRGKGKTRVHNYGGIRVAQRAATKRRNVIRNRKAHR